jgi:WD40 repeat protein
VAVRDNRGLTLWPLAWRHPHVLRAPRKGLWALAVDPRGRWIAAAGSSAAQVGLWPLAPEAGAERLALEASAPVYGLAVSPRGDRFAAATQAGVGLVQRQPGRPERLPGFEGIVLGVDFDPDGRRVAAGGVGNPLERWIHVWDLKTHTSQVLDRGDGQPIYSVAFLPDGRILSSGGAGVRVWDTAAGRSTPVLEGAPLGYLSRDGRRLLALRARTGPGGAVGTAVVHDVERKETRALETHGDQVISLAWDASEQLVVTGSRDGVVRVGPVTGEEPHLLLGLEGAVRDVEVARDGAWIASAGEDGTVRIWPLPAAGPPIHALPLGELLERLRSLTNFRIVRDRGAAAGYRLGFEPFAGWNRKPPQW